MTTFYYVAVSTSAKRKMSGKIESASEKDARMELNKMGLAILNLATEKPADFEDTATAKEITFEFIAKDKSDKETNGTINAISPEAAYDKLIAEFHFEVKAVYPASASAEEKAKAVKDGIKSILAAKAQNQAENLKISNATEAKSDISYEGSSEGSNTNSALETKPAFFDSKVLQAKFSQLITLLKKFYSRLAELFVSNYGDDEGENSPALSQNSSGSVATVSNDSGKLFFLDPMKRKAFFQRSWMILEDVTGILAFIYFCYFIFGSLALRYEWGAFTELAINTLQDSTVIPFFAFTFIFVYLLIWLREKFTSWSPMRTTLLFTSGSLFLFLLALNLLH